VTELVKRRHRVDEQTCDQVDAASPPSRAEALTGLMQRRHRAVGPAQVAAKPDAGWLVSGGFAPYPQPTPSPGSEVGLG
jgi:hypothetical protein